MPGFVETLAENGGTDREETLCTGSTPVHAWTTETSFVLFGSAFDHATTDGITFHAHLEIVQAFEVVLEITGLLEEGFGFVGLEGGLAFESRDQFSAVSQIQIMRPTAVPGALFGGSFAIEDSSGFRQVFFGMEPID